LKDKGIKVNSVDPGYSATDLRGRQTVAEGAAPLAGFWIHIHWRENRF